MLHPSKKGSQSLSIMTVEWEGITTGYVKDKCPDIDEVVFWDYFVTAFSNLDNFTIRVEGPGSPTGRDAAAATAKLIIDMWTKNYPDRIRAAKNPQRG